MAKAVQWMRDPIGRMEIEMQQWGAWVRQGVWSGLGYGSSVLGDLRGSTVPTPQISDERALQIDRAMNRLRHQDVRLYMALRLHYVDEMKPSAWCRHAGVSSSTAYATTLPMALRWMVAEVGIE